MLVEEFLSYLKVQRRYSLRTVAIYRDVLQCFISQECEGANPEEQVIIRQLSPVVIRNHIVWLMEERKLGTRSVNQHLSVLSSFCRYLVHTGRLDSNPMRLIVRPKEEKRLPVFYREESMEKWFQATTYYAGRDALELMLASGPQSKIYGERYSRRLSRLIVSMLFNTGMRRAELVSLDRSSVDFARKVIKVQGKGDKMREIPILPSLCEEILLYLQAVDSMFGGQEDSRSPLLLTPGGRRIYPVFVDRAVKAELGSNSDITGRKSPHVLRHSLATGLLNEGTDLNSIKELLGHSSLAATQVYTHTSVEKLKTIYDNAHPRAKNKGNNGD